MKRIHAYLHLNGKCREAMVFYQKCLGGTLELIKVGESPMATELPSEKGAAILHGRLSHDSLVLMGSDLDQPGQQPGDTVSLCLECNDPHWAESIFTSLSEGGKIIHPLHQTFWGGTYGEFLDQFAVRWAIVMSRK